MSARRPALLGVAHGSPDPRAEPVLEALMARVRAERPGLDATLAYLGHSQPSVPRAIDALAAQGTDDVVLVPLLLGAAYHARTDVPALLDVARRAHAGLTVVETDVLGPDPALEALARRMVAESGAPPQTALVLGAIGAADAGANAVTAEVAGRLGARVGFATCAPTVAGAVAAARAEGAQHVTVISYVISPGVLPDRFLAAGADLVTPAFRAAPELVSVVLSRYDAAALATTSVITPPR